MKEPGVDQDLGVAGKCGAIDSQHHFVSSRRRRIGALVSSEEAIGKENIRRAEGKAYRIGGPAGEHAGAVKRNHTDTVEGGGAAEQVHGQKIGILDLPGPLVAHRETTRRRRDRGSATRRYTGRTKCLETKEKRSRL